MAIATQTNLDALTTGAFMKQLEYVETRVMEYNYPQYKAAAGLLFPIEEMSIPWADTTTFRMMDAVGSDFEVADEQSTALSYVDTVSEEFSQRIYTFRKGYYFTEKEVIRTAHLGIPIEQQKIAAVRKSYLQTLNKLLLTGNARIGMAGLINHPAWLRSVAPFPLNSSSTLLQQLATLNQGQIGIDRATQNTEQADTLLLPKTQYDYLTSQSFVGADLRQSTLRFFIDNNPSIRNVDYLNELAGAGPGGTDVAIFYRRDPLAFVARITDPFRYRPLVQEPFRVYRPVAFDYNGIIPYVPYSVHVMIGV